RAAIMVGMISSLWCGESEVPIVGPVPQRTVNQPHDLFSLHRTQNLTKGTDMKTTTGVLAAALALMPLSALAQAQPSGAAYEKNSYNYAEWAKGRFSEVVTVRNPGKIIYLGGVGAEDETSAQGGAIRHLGDFGAQCRYAWDKIKRLLEKHGATLANVDKA